MEDGHSKVYPLGIVAEYSLYIFYYPPEVRRGDYWGLGVFLLQYFPLVNVRKCCALIVFTGIHLGSKNKKHLRGSTQAKMHPLALILTLAPTGLGQYNSLGKYCGPHTASSVFLI